MPSFLSRDEGYWYWYMYCVCDCDCVLCSVQNVRVLPVLICLLVIGSFVKVRGVRISFSCSCGILTSYS